MLRRAIFGVAALAAVGGAALIAAGAFAPGAYLLLGGIVVAAALLIERGRYRSRGERPGAREEATGERFVDPATGQEVEVRYDPATGRRRYVSRGGRDSGGPPGTAR